MEDNEEGILFLTSLPDSYDDYVDSLLCGKDTISIDQALAALLLRETRKKQKDDGEFDNQVLTVEGQKRSAGRLRGGKSGSNNVQCYRCKGFGHIKRDCPKKTGDERNGELNLLINDYESELLAVLEGMDAISCDEWYLDSACVTHVCSRKDYFDSLQERLAGTLTVGNKSKVSVMGYGVVKIKMDDGNVHALVDVAYVPELCGNLISLSLLDSQGCEYSASGGVVKVTRGDMILMRGILHKGLYRLQGKTSTEWKRCAKDGSYQRRLPYIKEEAEGFHDVDDGARTINLVKVRELEGSSRSLSKAN